MAREVLVQFRLTEEEARAVQRFAVSRGLKVSSLARNLLVGSAMGEVIDAWIREPGDTINESSTVHFKLEPIVPVQADEIVVRAYERSRDMRGNDAYIGPCSSISLGQYSFFRAPETNGLHLRGGGEWFVAGQVDITPLDGAKPYSRLTLRRRRSN